MDEGMRGSQAGIGPPVRLRCRPQTRGAAERLAAGGHRSQSACALRPCGGSGTSAADPAPRVRIADASPAAGMSRRWRVAGVVRPTVVVWHVVKEGIAFGL